MLSISRTEYLTINLRQRQFNEFFDIKGYFPFEIRLFEQKQSCTYKTIIIIITFIKKGNYNFHKCMLWIDPILKSVSSAKF